MYLTDHIANTIYIEQAEVKELTKAKTKEVDDLAEDYEDEIEELKKQIRSKWGIDRQPWI